MSAQTSVVIVGAGPAGLAMAIELGMRRVPCLVVERNDRVGYAPRAKTTHTRTREHLRRWGIADKLAQASPFGVDYPSNVVFTTRLAGHELARFENAFNCDPTPNPLYSEHAQWIPQYRLEEVLRAHAESLPSVEIKFNCEFEDCRQSDRGVVSQLRDLNTRKISTVESAFVAGADGARSRVREIMGAKLEGAYGLSRNYNIVFRAPGLKDAHSHGPAIMYWQVNADTPSLIGPMDTGDRWFFMPTGVPEGGRLADAEASDLIRRATGIALPYEILSTDEWVASRFVSNTYRQGRVFLIGDACHLHPPFGGYGMNMGIGDAVDLGWKIAAVLQGWGGAALLDSYVRERRPVHRQVIDEAVANHSVLGNQLWREGLEDDSAEGSALRRQVGAVIEQSKRREFNNLELVLGYRYSGSPVIASDDQDDDEGAAKPELSPIYHPLARPGRRAPHLWLAPGDSLYDHFGAGFTLLVAGPSSEHEIQVVAEDARRLSVPLKIIQPEDPRLAELYQTRLTLIRPDHHVAWRGDAWASADVLARACGLAVKRSA